MYRIAAARPSDLPLLPAIELAAATLLAGHAPAAVLAETTSQAELEDAQRRGHQWVALADDVPVGFASVEVLETGIAHLEEIDVHPEHGRRGLGRRLVTQRIQPADLSTALQSVIDDETQRGLDPGRRVAMRRPCVPKGPAEVRSERKS